MAGDSVWIDLLGYLSAAFVFLTFCMKTMVSLRITAIASNVAFIGYAAAAHLPPILILHGLLLPLNVGRLVQMLRHVRMARRAKEKSTAGADFKWLVPYARKRHLPAGATLFEKGSRADCLYVILDGTIRLPEINVELGRFDMLGEIGLFSGEGLRTTSAEAVTDVSLAELSERRVRELYFDNPEFAYTLIQMITRRLTENLSRSGKG